MAEVKKTDPLCCDQEMPSRSAYRLRMSVVFSCAKTCLSQGQRGGPAAMALGVGGWAEVRPGFERIVEGRMGGVHVLRCMHCTFTKNKSQMLA